MWNIETGALYWPECAAALFGHESKTVETTYEAYLAARHPNDRRGVEDAIKTCLETARDFDVEHVVQVAIEEALPLALILNKLMFNAIKHHDRHSEPVRVYLRCAVGTARISIAGPGTHLPPGFDLATGQGLIKTRHEVRVVPHDYYKINSGRIIYMRGHRILLADDDRTSLSTLG